MNNVDSLVADIYKNHSAKLLAVLTRLFGTQNLELAEDVLQDAFNKALTNWQKDIPDNPTAWITQAAKNQAIDVIRANKTKLKFSQDLSHHLKSEWSLGNTVEQEFTADKIQDDQLRMIFMCCHDSIKPENRIPFILKTLCGFSTLAISRALLLPEETIKKRLFRTRKQLKNHIFAMPESEELINTMDTVHTILYLLFNEGFYSTNNKQAIHILFCQEAIGLMTLLLEEPSIVNQDTYGLLALMHFHIARINSRINAKGFNIPIELQDRSLWQQPYIHTGKQFLLLGNTAKAGATGRFYIEAQIANEHCSASTFSKTNWAAIIQHYEKLYTISDSPVVRLNQAVAIAYDGNLDKAIQIVSKLQTDKALQNSHLPSATLAHFYAMQGNKEKAYTCAKNSQAMGGTPIEQQMMMQQLERLLNT